MAFADWLNESTPDRREVTVCFDRRLLSAFSALQERIAANQAASADEPQMLGGSDDPDEIELEQLRAEVAEKSHVLVFEGIGWQAWRDLLAAHPPKKDQHEIFAKAVQLAFMPHSLLNLGFHAETFVPAAIAASCVDPGITAEEAAEMLRNSPPGVIERIWTAVLGVNLAGDDDPFVLASPTASSVVPLASARK